MVTNRATTIRFIITILGSYLFNSCLLKHGRSDGIEISNGVAVISFGKIQTDIIQRLALGQVVIILISKEGRTHATDQGLREPMEDVESGKIARLASWRWC